MTASRTGLTATDLVLKGAGVDPQGHASVAVTVTITPERITMTSGFDVVVRREEVNAVRVRWPRPWEGLPVAPSVAVQTESRRRWRRLFIAPYFIYEQMSPRRLRSELRERGWPVDW